VLESIHTNLFNIVGEAVAPVVTTEKTWSQQEMVKHIVRYIYRAAQSPELLTLRWQELGKRLVDQAMGSYGSACQDRQWFYEIDLSQAFASAAWELLCLNGKPRVRFSQIKELVEQEYEECLDKTLLTKAMWEATSMIFSDIKAQSKIYTALHKTYQGALEETMADSRPLEKLQRVEIFIRKWIDDSMRRAWCSLEAVEDTLTDKCVLRLFQALVAPFGDEHPYSCIPDCLTRGIGRPPREWKFIGQVVKQLFHTWKIEAMSSGIGGSSRKRRKGSSAAPVAYSEASPEHLNCFAHKARCFSETPPWKSEKAEPFLEREPSPAGSSDPEDGPVDDMEEVEEAEEADEAEDESDVKRQQHPDCTSAEDCVGYRGQHLIRHMVDRAQQGDIYCEECWRNFLEINRNLQGVWQDGPLQGQPVDTHLSMPNNI